MVDEDLQKAFAHFWEGQDWANDYPAIRPILAHYTSIQTLELIVKAEEVWLSNPLLMNDTQELRHGLDLAGLCLRSNSYLSQTFGPDGLNKLVDSYFRKHQAFGTEHAFDTYVASFSEHEEGDEDGLLSMWRGYGVNGSGAALIFQTASLQPPEGTTPLVLGRVHYKTDSQRIEWITERLEAFGRSAMQAGVTNDRFDDLGELLFNRFLMAALFTKHKGFSEEKEWRAAYLAYLDPGKRYSDRFCYLNGPRGVEPKFRLPFGKTSEFGGDLTIEKVLTKILLGPTASSLLSVMSVQRMLRLLDKEALAERVKASSIPYRVP